MFVSVKLYIWYGGYFLPTCQSLISTCQSLISTCLPLSSAAYQLVWYVLSLFSYAYQLVWYAYFFQMLVNLFSLCPGMLLNFQLSKSYVLEVSTVHAFSLMSYLYVQAFLPHCPPLFSALSCFSFYCQVFSIFSTSNTCNLFLSMIKCW